MLLKYIKPDLNKPRSDNMFFDENTLNKNITS